VSNVSAQRVTNRVLEHDCQNTADYFAQEDEDQKRHKLNKKTRTRVTYRKESTRQQYGNCNKSSHRTFTERHYSPRQGSGVLWWACLCVCVCLSTIISSELHVGSSPKFLCLLPMAVVRASSSGSMDDVIFVHKQSLLDVAGKLKHSAHTALGLTVNCAQ